jgi:hypothetical protein
VRGSCSPARAGSPFGFPDAFNPHTGWVAEDVVAINVGITLVMAENRRSGFGRGPCNARPGCGAA